MWLACLLGRTTSKEGRRQSVVSQTSNGERPAVRATLVLLQISPKSSLEKIGTVAESGHSKNVDETDAGEVAAAV
jgi:hypothetical protein